MSSKYAVIFDPVFDEGVKDGALCEGEKRIGNAVVFLLDSRIKTDKQAVRKFAGIEENLKQRAKEIRLCKTLKVTTRWCG